MAGRSIEQCVEFVWPDRAEPDGLHASLATWITPAEFGRLTGRSSATVYGLLARGLIRGAARVTPGEKGSPWRIPRDAPAKFNTNPDAALQSQEGVAYGAGEA